MDMKRFFLSILFAILRNLAKIVLSRHKPEIIAITGSVGKSSTKEAVFAVLREKYPKTGKSTGNLNNELGLPLAILSFKKSPSLLTWPFILIWSFFKMLWYLIAPYPKILVLEMAADKPGDISYLTSFIKPKVGIVLNVGPAHLEKFGTLEAVAKEKGKLVEVLPKNGLAVLNEDDPYVKGMAQLSSAHIEFFRDRRLENETAVATIIGQFYKIEEKLIKQGLGKIEKLPQRMVWLNGKKGCTIIDDSYNANPLSMKWALDVLAKQEGRRVAVLGEMAQQGKNSGQAHQEVIDLAKKSADQIILVGKEFQNMSDIWFKDSQSAAENIGKYIQKGDMVLVKGSRSTQMEKIVDMLKE